MKSIITYILAIIVVILTILLLLKDNVANRTESSQFIVKGDSIVKWDTIRIPAPFEVYSDPEIITLPADTQCILEWLELRNLYTQHKVYNDTLQNDTSALVVVIDTVYKNSLRKRVYGFQNKRIKSITTINNYTTINDRGWLVGCSLGFNTVIPYTYYIYGKYMFSIGYDIHNTTPLLGVALRL